MIPSEGIAAMLKAITAQPMLLCLFSDGPDPDPANSALITSSDFTEPTYYERFAVERRQWRIDEAQQEAALDDHRFAFSGPAGMVAGWCLLLAKDKSVIAFDRFANPYPINSDRDAVSVRARLRLRE